jgi:GNAT superfamily N-acetyltransferase
MDPAPLALLAADLAPGDSASTDFDWASLRVVRIRRPDHPLLEPVYSRLWREFGARGEMETRPVIDARLRDDARGAGDRPALLYEILAVESGGDIVAVRDHTAIAAAARAVGEQPSVVVHLSHLLIEPRWRGSGLSAWLRAFPIQTARECAAVAGAPHGDRITLAAEMEHVDGGSPDVIARLRSYERAGFSKIDPERVPYCQPDFRAPAVIDRTCVRPVPLALVIRRVGREGEAEIRGSEARAIVAALYAMYGAHLRADHMAPLWALLNLFPAPDESIALRRPLQ